VHPAISGPQYLNRFLYLAAVWRPCGNPVEIAWEVSKVRTADRAMFRRCAVIAGKMMQTTTEDHQLIARSTA
jgi:hypothetical protein